MKQSREKGKLGGIPGISINLVPQFKERGEKGGVPLKAHNEER